MPRLAKTAQAAIAALVVTVAAAVAAAVAPTGDRPPVAVVTTAPGGSTAPSSGPLASASSAPGAILFVGGAVSLKPRGGVAKSFACRASISVGAQCRVRTAGDPVGALPASAEVVVVAAAVGDDATAVRAVIDALPPQFARSRLVILGPVVVGGTEAVTRQVTGLRRLATERQALFVDPVGGHWVTAATRSKYLAGDTGQLTASGHEYAAARFAAALRQSRPPLPGIAATAS